MKQRVITAVVLLALLAVVVWQINTPVLVLVIAFLAAVAANEIMRCAKVENTFIRVVATGYAACVPFFASAKALTPWVSEAVWGKVIGAVPGVVYLIALVLVLLLAMLKGYAYTTFEDVAVSVFAGALVPFGGPQLSPMLGAGAMALSSVFVLGNALRLRRLQGVRA